MWVYLNSEPGLWTTGFYKPDGKWEPDEDFNDVDAARARVAELNGNGNAAPLVKRIEDLESGLARTVHLVAIVGSAVGSAPVVSRPRLGGIDFSRLTDTELAGLASAAETDARALAVAVHALLDSGAGFTLAELDRDMLRQLANAVAPRVA